MLTFIEMKEFQPQLKLLSELENVVLFHSKKFDIFKTKSNKKYLQIIISE